MLYLWGIWMVGVPLSVYFMREVVLGKDNNKYPLVFCAALWPLFLSGMATWKLVAYFSSLKAKADTADIV